MKSVKLFLTIVVVMFVITGAAYTPVSLFESQFNMQNAGRTTGDKTYSKEFKVKSGQSLKLDMEIGADIQVESWNKEIVNINIRLRGSDADDITVNFEETAGGIEVEADYDGHGKNRNSDGLVTVKVPSKFNVEFTTMGGDVTLNGIEGMLTGKTMGGELTLKNLKGKLELTTMGGDIDLNNSDVDGFVKTMGGDIMVENVTGSVNAKTMGGDIKQKDVKNKSDKSIGSEVNLETMGGEIIVDEAPNGAKVKTMGGEITVNKASAFVDATTMGGNIFIKSVDGWVQAKTMGGDVEVKVIQSGSEGKKDISLSSMGGDIKLYLPADFSMDLDLEIEFDRNHEDEVGIESDFKFDEKKTAEWEHSNGDKRKHIYGTGTINGGQHQVKIKTHNGNIYLKKN